MTSLYQQEMSCNWEAAQRALPTLSKSALQAIASIRVIEQLTFMGGSAGSRGLKSFIPDDEENQVYRCLSKPSKQEKAAQKKPGFVPAIWLLPRWKLDDQMLGGLCEVS